MKKKEFKAESKKLLNLMINSIYTNQEIFLRELISNASDACDKLRYLCLTNPEIAKNSSEMKIKIVPNVEEKTLLIEDNGIGMNRDDLINHLGTIAKSGTAEFVKNMKSHLILF